MNPLAKLLLTTGAVAAVIVGVGMAISSAMPLHVQTIRYPNGAVERVIYAGSARPDAGARAIGAFVDPTTAEAGSILSDPAVAEMARLSAEMDREAAMMPRAAPDLQTTSAGAPFPALAFAPGVRDYSVVTTVTGGHVCSRSVVYGPAAAGAAPRVVTRVSGDCGATAAPLTHPQNNRNMQV